MKYIFKNKRILFGSVIDYYKSWFGKRLKIFDIIGIILSIVFLLLIPIEKSYLLKKLFFIFAITGGFYLFIAVAYPLFPFVFFPLLINIVLLATVPIIFIAILFEVVADMFIEKSWIDIKIKKNEIKPSQIFNLLSDGKAIEEIQYLNSGLSKIEIISCLKYAADTFDNMDLDEIVFLTNQKRRKEIQDRIDYISRRRSKG